MFELAVAAVALVFGVRSALHWTSRPFESRDLVDHMLYALYLTGRVGLWFAFAGAFAIFGLTRTRGRAFVDDVAGYRWYVLVFVALGAMQFLAGYALGRRREDPTIPRP